MICMQMTPDLTDGREDVFKLGDRELPFPTAVFRGDITLLDISDRLWMRVGTVALRYESVWVLWEGPEGLAVLDKISGMVCHRLDEFYTWSLSPTGWSYER